MEWSFLISATSSLRFFSPFLVVLCLLHKHFPSFSHTQNNSDGHGWDDEPLYVPPGRRRVVWHHFDLFLYFTFIFSESHVAVLCSNGSYHNHVIDFFLCIDFVSVFGRQMLICLSVVLIIEQKAFSWFHLTIIPWSDLTLWIVNWCALTFSARLEMRVCIP